MIGITVLNVEGDAFDLIALGDLHYGASGQTRPLIRKSLKEAEKSTIPCKVISIGDNLENTIKHSEGGETTPQDAVEELADDFRAYIEKGLVEGFIIGNHDRNVTKAARAKADLLQSKVVEWNEAYKTNVFYATAHLLVIKFKNGGKNPSVSILLHHGFGGGRTIGTIFNNLEKMLGVVCNPDIIICGHRHVEGHAVIGRYFFNHQHNSLVKKEVHLVATGANLEDADYALRFGLPPSIPSNSRIKIRMSRNGQGEVLNVQVEGIR